MKYNSILISSSRGAVYVCLYAITLTWGGMCVCLYAITLTWGVGFVVCTLLPSLW